MQFKLDFFSSNRNPRRPLHAGHDRVGVSVLLAQTLEFAEPCKEYGFDARLVGFVREVVINIA